MINEIKNIEIEMKKIFNLIVILFFGLTFAACVDDDEEMSKSPLIGTWTKQIQWAYTDGTRDHSYTFYADGTGRLKSWDWFDQKYKYQKYNWSATDAVISFDMEELPDGGYVSGIRYYTVTPTSLTLFHSDGDLDGVYTKE